MTVQHFLSIAETSPDDLRRVLRRGFELREERREGVEHEPVMAGRTLAMLFEKPSLRTRVSIEQGVVELGGHPLVLGQHEVGLGKRESVEDVTRVLAGMVHGIAARVFHHDTLLRMRDAAPLGVPVINMLSDLSHPCQALADVMTLADEFATTPRGVDLDRLAGRRVAFIGDGNNVCRSLAMLCGKLGIDFTLASPPDYALDDAFARRVMEALGAGGGASMDFRLTHDPAAAVHDADAVVTDTFVSMGHEDEKASRLRAFEGFRVDETLMRHAPEHAIVLHCLPAYRGVEISDGVMDGPQSRVFPEAHNRLHAQKGLLAVLFE